MSAPSQPRNTKWMCPHCGHESHGELSDHMCPTCGNLLCNVTLEKLGKGSISLTRRKAVFRAGAHYCVLGLILAVIGYFFGDLPNRDTHPAVNNAVFRCIAQLVIVGGLSNIYHVTRTYRPGLGFMMVLLLLRVPLLEYQILYDPYFRQTALAMLLYASGLVLVAGICHLASRVAKELGVGQGNLFESLSWVCGTAFCLMVGPTIVSVSHEWGILFLWGLAGSSLLCFIMLGMTLAQLLDDRQKA